jgi:hypothetical protein
MAGMLHKICALALQRRPRLASHSTTCKVPVKRTGQHELARWS